jgi:hypothetical protein
LNTEENLDNSISDAQFMRLARQGYGATLPKPKRIPSIPVEGKIGRAVFVFDDF